MSSDFRDVVGDCGVHIYALIALVFCGCARTCNQPSRDAAAVRVFAAESVSTGNVYRGSFTPDGRSLYFFKNVTEGEEDYRIFRSDLTADAWSEPRRVGLGGDHSDLYPTISPDGRRIVFSSYRSVDGDTTTAPNANLWYADWTDGRWGVPVFMSAPSTLANYDAKPFFGSDGEIYFESTTPDWRTTHSLVTRWNGREYGAPEIFEAVERWRGWREDLYVWGGVPGPDGSFVVLDVSGRDAETGRALSSDQWVSVRNADGGWADPVRLDGGLNSDGYDNLTFFSADGAELYFVRDFNQFYRVQLSSVLASIR